MNWIQPLIMIALLALVALCAGSETGIYSLSRVRLDAEARAGSQRARLLQGLLRDETWLLVTLLVGINLALELLAWVAGSWIAGLAAIPDGASEVVTVVVLTPVTLFAAQLLPKDLFHRRPHSLLALVVWPLTTLRVVLAPLALPLRAVAAVLERVLGVERAAVERAFGREAVLALLDEGTRQGAIGPGVRQLADNALRLRSTPVSRVMVPWKSAERLELARGQLELLAQVARSAHTRLPMVDAEGRATGYVHQLEVLASIEETREGLRLEDHLRPIEVLPGELPVDRALARLRQRGQRLALVGTAEKPLGLVSLKDLVEEISGQLERW